MAKRHYSIWPLYISLIFLCQLVFSLSTILFVLGNIACFSSSADFPQRIFPKHFFRNTIIVSNSLDTDQARRLVGPNLGPNCLQRLSADDISRRRSDLIAHIKTSPF